MRLIDADALVPKAYKSGDWGNPKVVDLVEIEYAPTIDAVEVIRCEDCQMFNEFTDDYQKLTGADGECSVRALFSAVEAFCDCKKTDYCSMAKRRAKK